MPKILIGDDDHISCDLLKYILRSAHPEYEFSVAHDGSEVLRLAAEEKFDLILLDIVMPGKDGFEVLSLLKADKALMHIPVILITAMYETEQKIKGFRLGAADYIIKPLNGEEANARVETHLRMKRAYDDLRALNEDMRRTQSALIESSKMAAVGNLAAGIAHEFNNILFIMSGYLQLHEIAPQKTDTDQLYKSFKELVARAGGIVNGLMQFVKTGDMKESTDINALLEKDLALLDKLVTNGGVTLEKDFGELPKVSVSPSQISQVFVNLILNAVDAMRPREERLLTIKTWYEKDCQRCPVEACRNMVAGGCAVISFKDTGGGIPARVKDRMFHPFVTTKGVIGGGDDDVSPGKGLGLFVSYGIVQNHGGRLAFASSDGEGTEFFVVLPAAANAPAISAVKEG